MPCGRCGRFGLTVRTRTIVEEGGGRGFEANVCDPCWTAFKATYDMRSVFTDEEISTFLDSQEDQDG
jgi:hypothetical protein